MKKKPGRLMVAKPVAVRVPVSGSVSAAVFLALYGMPHAVCAQERSANAQKTDSSNMLTEVIVTSQRREQTLEQVPYNLSVVSSEDLDRTGVTDLASLASTVPGISTYNFGSRYAADAPPVIRGLNATGAPFGFRSFEQNPVGTYIGNSPIIDGYFQLDDIQRIEILRGPQGTLYGAGALGGAIRIIPNAPELGIFSGHLDGSAGRLDHSSGSSYTGSGVLNIPLGDTLAFRASGKYAYEPGFINVYGILARPGSADSGIPLLADPGDPVTSPGIVTGKNDWNFQKTYTTRASALWKPSDNFNAELSITDAHVDGDGGPFNNSAFPGGPSPVDPRTTFPAGGQYQAFSAVDQPYSRTTTLESLDLSYDAGFATLSSTSSYFSTNGSTVTDNTYLLAGYTAPAQFPLLNYYAGNPVNPRYVNPNVFLDSAYEFTQEIRLVSAAAPDKKLDYTLGIFYQHLENLGAWYDSNPGSPEYSRAEGCTSPYFAGASFPDCLVISGPGDNHFTQVDKQHFQEKAEFGEVTWHLAPHVQITGGVRHSEQDFTDSQSFSLYTFSNFVSGTPNSTSFSKTTGKVNSSFEYADRQYVYATWSQGFRRGGANSVPTVGPVRECTCLVTYAPDTVNNYELGLKGRFANDVSYTFDVFDDEWDKPQISAALPSGTLAVYNGDKARSRGFELESSGPLLIGGLQYKFGLTYADAILTEPYSYPANNGYGTGTIVPGLVHGSAGEQLPGSSKLTTSETMVYSIAVVPTYDLAISLNHTYRSQMPLVLSGSYFSVSHSPGFGLVNLNATLSHKNWMVVGYSTNLLDKRVVLAPDSFPAGLSDNTILEGGTVNMPREAGIRVRYSF